MTISLSLHGLQMQIEHKGIFKSTEKNEASKEDYLFAGEQLHFTGTAKDFFFGGKNLTFSGKTLSSLIAGGKQLDISGKVDNDLIAAGKEVRVSGRVEDQAFLAGAEVTIDKESVINGSLFVAGGKVTIKGTINGDVYVATGNLRVDGMVKGNVKCYAGAVQITENGRIIKDFTYTTERQLSQAEEERVNGSVYFSASESKGWGKKEKFASSTFRLVFGIITFMSLLVCGVLLLLLPVLRDMNYAGRTAQIRNYLLWGLLPFFIYPMAVIVSMIMVVTIPMGLLLIAAAIPLFVISQIIGITQFGQFLFTNFRWKKQNRFLYFLLGMALFFILGLIPVISCLRVVFFSCIGWGILLEGIFNTKLAK